MVTDYDSWHPGHGEVDITRIVATLGTNAFQASTLIATLPTRSGSDRIPCPPGCDRALTHALITAPAASDAALVAKLDAVAGRVLKG